MNARYRIDWIGGASAGLDLQPVRSEEGRYQLKYTSPFRSTMRAPSQELPLSVSELDDLIKDRVEAFALRMVTGGRGSPARSVGGGGDAGIDQLVEIGRNLFTQVLPDYLASDFRDRDLFIELSTDEALLHYPWELLHDGDEFMCLKHFMGRFINLSRADQAVGAARLGPARELGPLKVLLVSVSQPQARGGLQFDELPAARLEAEAVLDAMGRVGIEVECLSDAKATRDAVVRALRDGTYHIIHFTGHAWFDAQDARKNALILDDHNVTVGTLTGLLRGHNSVLCFVNGCETTRVRSGVTPEVTGGVRSWREEYDIYGLARAFLGTGAYLLGSRWKLPDSTASTFAATFYTSLLDEGLPIGRAVTAARRACFEQAPVEDYSWASYVFYGDPRLCLTRAEGSPVVDTHMEAPSSGASGRAHASVSGRAAPLATESQEDSGGRDGTDSTQTLEALASEYDRIQEEFPSGHARTRLMSKLVRTVSDLNQNHSLTSAVPKLWQKSSGGRIAALALLEAHPDPTNLDVVVEGLTDSRSAFEQYHALSVAGEMASALTAAQKDRIARAVERVLENDAVVGTDRFGKAMHVQSLLLG